MTAVFREILSMSFTAGFCVLAVALVRLFLKKTPRVFSYALWAVVLFRLLCPFSFESVVSLIPSTQAVQPTGQTGLPFEAATNIPVIDQPVNAYLGSHYYEGVTVPAGFSVDFMTVLSIVWLAGCLILLGISLISLFRLKKRLRNAVLEEGRVYHAKGLETAFVLGIFRPKIYLPEGLSGKEREYILLHEQTHIRQGDHIVRVLAFLALCLHWFNPLAWAAFFLSGRDMEMSCDEAVLKKLGNGVKKDYSASLLSLASGRKWLGGTPLAFGEGDTRSRIKNVLSYRKPAFWVLIAAVIGVAAAIFLLAANPLEKRDSMKWLNSLDAEDVRQIELVVMPASENELYALYTEEADISAIVSLLREGGGRYVADPKSLAGGIQTFYLTMADGSRHRVANNANAYLVIDGDSFDAGHDWLSSWEKDYGRGNAPLPEGFSFDTAASLFGQELGVETIVYRAPEYSLDISPDGAPRYRFTQDGRLLESNGWVLAGGSGDWTDCGTLEEITLTRENFDSLFTIQDEGFWDDTLSPEVLRKNTRTAWKAVRENGDSSVLYYVLLQDNGSVFLTYGYEQRGGLQYPNIRWVFQLVTDAVLAQAEAETLFALRTDFVGSSSDVGNLLEKLGFPEPRDGFSLQTSAEPYGVTVNFTGDAADLLPYEKNAVLLLALISSADVITYRFPSDAVSYDRQWAEEWTGLPDVWVDSVEELSSLLNFLNGIVDSESVAQSHPEWEGYAYTGETRISTGGRTFTLEDVPENPAEEAAANSYAYDIAENYEGLAELYSESEALLISAQNDAESWENGDYIQSYTIHGLETLPQSDIPSRIADEAEALGLEQYAVVRVDVDWTYSDQKLAQGPQLGEGRYSRLFLCGEKDGQWKIYEIYWEEMMGGSSTADSAAAESEYLQKVLDSVEFVEQGLTLTLPYGMPTEHPMEIRSYLDGTDEDGNPIHQEFFNDDLGSGTVGRKEGDEILLYLNPLEGFRLTFYLRFYEEGENGQRTETASQSAVWIGQDGEMVRQPSAENGGDSTAEAQISEADYLQMVINNVEFTENRANFTLPYGMPTEHPLEIRSSLDTTDEEGNRIHEDLFEEDLNNKRLRSGNFFQANVGGWKEGDEVLIYLRFYEEKDENQNLIRETTAWAAIWVYEDGQMVRQPWMKETVGLPEQYGQDLTVHFENPHSAPFLASMTLPEGWTAAPGGDFGLVLLTDESGKVAGRIQCDKVEYYPEAAGENFPVSVYSYLMLGSGTNWNNEYTPVKQGPENADGVPVTETAVVKIVHTEHGAAGPFTEYPGVLSYNLDILRYISIAFEENVPEETAKSIAESIILSEQRALDRCSQNTGFISAQNMLYCF